MSFINSLTFRVLAGSCILLFILFTLYSHLTVHFHTDQMMTKR